MTGSEGEKSFIIVKYGVTIDLVDLDGQVTNLSGRAKDYAHELVTPRGIYILIRVDRLPDNGQFHYTSLLNNLEETNPELMVL
ncbi:hypothetical protein MAR_010318 [Mya arenaria]|uniref:Uncharacterized protein n=1 Tax=Mya arenaria TaxID=6604 RepID=A0ABY7E490_MYAAR|nr:hypothetical protein MAR_010318 [Mya arenaria]